MPTLAAARMARYRQRQRALAEAEQREYNGAQRLLARTAERLRQWANVVANADLVTEELPAVAKAMVEVAESLERRVR